MTRPQQTELITGVIRAMQDNRVTASEVQEITCLASSLLVAAFVGGLAGRIVRNLVREALGPEQEKKLRPAFDLVLPASIPEGDLRRIADKYGWWAARLAEAVCPHNDVACVEREARRLVKARNR